MNPATTVPDICRTHWRRWIRHRSDVVGFDSTVFAHSWVLKHSIWSRPASAGLT